METREMNQIRVHDFFARQDHQNHGFPRLLFVPTDDAAQFLQGSNGAVGGLVRSDQSQRWAKQQHG
jgi:hypothetical protein